MKHRERGEPPTIFGDILDVIRIRSIEEKLVASAVPNGWLVNCLVETT
ncbi:MAG: hypothetical protein QXM12_04645 [Nitrososphaerota archaeon]